MGRVAKECLKISCKGVGGRFEKRSNGGFWWYQSVGEPLGAERSGLAGLTFTANGEGGTEERRVSLCIWLATPRGSAMATLMSVRAAWPCTQMHVRRHVVAWEPLQARRRTP